MRQALILTAALFAASATSAHAEEWCGYPARAHSIIECGYSSLDGCENAIGKGAMCFVNPDYVMNTRRATPVADAKASGPKS